MKRFEKEHLDRKDYRRLEILATITRILLLPVFLIVRVYFWVWDYDYSKLFLEIIDKLIES